VIRLMVNLLFVEDNDVLSKPGVVRTIYDPTAGTGGMLSIADEYLKEHTTGFRRRRREGCRVTSARTSGK
jgi:type I restriction enzyme M protein